MTGRGLNLEQTDQPSWSVVFMGKWENYNNVMQAKYIVLYTFVPFTQNSIF